MAIELDELPDKLAQERADLEARIRRGQKEVEELERQLERLMITIAELQRLGVDVEAVPASASERRNDERIVEMVLAADEGITDQDILDKLQAEGWSTEAADPLNLVRSYLSRAVKAGQIARVARSTYAPRNSTAAAKLADKNLASFINRAMEQAGKTREEVS